MAFKKISLQIICLINILSISPHAPDPIKETLLLDQSIIIVPQNADFPSLNYSSYLPNNFKSFSSGTDILSSFPSENISCKDVTNRTKNYVMNWCIAIFGVSLIALNIGFVFHFLWTKSHEHDSLKGKEEDSKDHHKQESDRNSQLITDQVKVFTFADIKGATFGFLQELIFAEGTFSTVYRGCLPDGREMAIKRAKELDKDTEECFQMELCILSEVHHDNLLSLVGFCMDNNERILVSEYMTNGSLNEHLYETKFRQGNPFNTWKLRTKILLDCARGIECLHNHANQGIIHRDIKTANILIDEKWNARISDLGFAILGPKPGSEQVCVEGVAGTRGYIDPQYNQTTRCVTFKSDVYSFGVVMIEMLTGKGAVFDGMIYTNYIAPKIMSGELLTTLDKRVRLRTRVDVQVVELIGELALRCVRYKTEQRPTMSEVVQEIQDILSLFG